MFAFTTGSFPALETSLQSAILSHQKSRPLSPVLVLVPTSRLITHLQRRLVAESPTPLLNVHFMTLYALAQRLVESGPSRDDRFIRDAGVLPELIYRLLTDPPETDLDRQLQHEFRTDRRYPETGLSHALAATVRDLYDSGIQAVDALKAAREGHLGDDTPEAAATLGLYARVVGQFETLDLRTGSDLLRRAAALAPEDPWLASQQAIWIYGFYDFTGVQLDLILALARHPRVEMIVPYVEGDADFSFVDQLIQDPGLQGKIGTRTRASLPVHTHDFSVISASGARDEVWAAAKEILHLADDGVPFHDIAWVARTLDPYLPFIREIFGDHAIPYSSSQHEAAGIQPVVKSFLAGLNALPPQARKDSWSAWSLNVLRAVPPSDGPIGAAIQERVESLQELDALQRPVSWDHFVQTVTDRLDRLEWPVNDAGTADAGVQVLDVQQARGLSFHTVIAAGLNEKVFPRLIREDPFLSDRARRSLSSAVGVRLGAKLDGYAEERLLFAMMKASARHRLIVTFQRSDDDGKSLIPSTLIQALMKAAPPKRIARVFHQKFIHRPFHSWTPGEASLLVNRAGIDPSALMNALGWDWDRYKTLLAAFRDLEAYRPAIGNHDGMVHDPRLPKRILRKGLSPTALETLAECPFRFFARYGFGLRPPEPPAIQGDLTPQALGKLIHKALEIVFQSFKTGGFTSASQDIADQTRRAIDQAFVGLIPESALYPLVLDSSKEAIFHLLLRYIESDLSDIRSSGYMPEAFEQTVSGRIPELGKELGDIEFHGRCDRIDIGMDNGQPRVRVLDFKTGREQASSGRIETAVTQGHFLQLPIYARLACIWASQHLGRRVDDCRAEIRWVRSEASAGDHKTITMDFWKSSVSRVFIENMKVIVDLIRTSHFFIEPSEGPWGYCSRCAFAMICRKEHMRTRIRAEGDPVRVSLRAHLDRTAPKET